MSVGYAMFSGDRRPGDKVVKVFREVGGSENSSFHSHGIPSKVVPDSKCWAPRTVYGAVPYGTWPFESPTERERCLPAVRSWVARGVFGPAGDWGQSTARCCRLSSG